MFYAVMNWDENFKVVKLQSFSTLVEAETFASENGGILPGTSADAFASEELDGPEEGWVADPVGKVLLYIPVDHTKDIQEAISIEAERRIEAGTLIGANAIRCDDQSVSRIHGMLKKAERLEAQSKPVHLKFKTKAKDTVIIDSAAMAGAVYDGISDHVAFILGRSADLQDQTPEQLAAFDPRLDAHWME